MMPRNTPDSVGDAYQKNIRRKLVDMLLDEYKVRKDRGELLYNGRWISPDKKYDFIEELRKEHKGFLQDSIVLLVLGFVGAYLLILLIRAFFFPI